MRLLLGRMTVVMVMRMTVPAASAASTDPARPGKVHAHVRKATMGRLPHDRNPINHVVLVFGRRRLQGADISTTLVAV